MFNPDSSSPPGRAPPPVFRAAPGPRPPLPRRPEFGTTGHRPALSPSIFSGSHDLTAGDRPQGQPDLDGHGLGDESHRSVSHQGVDPARMATRGGDDRLAVVVLRAAE